MPVQDDDKPAPDWKELASAYGFAIPDDELEEVANVLTPLVKECRDSYEETLDSSEPVGTFRPEER